MVRTLNRLAVTIWTGERRSFWTGLLIGLCLGCVGVALMVVDVLLRNRGIHMPSSAQGLVEYGFWPLLIAVVICGYAYAKRRAHND